MSSEREYPVHLRVLFSDRARTSRALEELSRTGAGTVDVLSARITGEASWFELRLRGTPRGIRERVRVIRKSATSARSIGSAALFAR